MAMRRWRTPQQCVRPRSRRPPSPPPAVRFCGTRGRASRRASSKTGRSTSSATRFRTHLQRSVTRPSLARLRTPRRWASPLLPTCPRRGPISRAIAASAGLQVAVHAIGDRANAILLSIYDSVAKAHGPRDRRFRVEHAQHLRPQDILLFGTLGVIASVQPYHAIDDGRWVEQRIGPVRIRTTYPFRTLLDTGAKLAFGSDWTVAPLDPILGVYTAVTRRTLDGKNPNGWVPEQKISVGEALRAYTAGNAYAAFDDGRRSTMD